MGGWKDTKQITFSERYVDCFVNNIDKIFVCIMSKLIHSKYIPEKIFDGSEVISPVVFQSRTKRPQNMKENLHH